MMGSLGRDSEWKCLSSKKFFGECLQRTGVILGKITYCLELIAIPELSCETFGKMSVGSEGGVWVAYYSIH